MKHFYSVPTVTFTAPPSRAHWLACPGAPAVTVVVVEEWLDHAEQDAWEALPGVVEHYIEALGFVAPAAVITAFAPWGATTGMTLRQVFGLIRAQWPVWRL